MGFFPWWENRIRKKKGCQKSHQPQKEQRGERAAQPKPNQRKGQTRDKETKDTKEPAPWPETRGSARPRKSGGEESREKGKEPKVEKGGTCKE